MKKWAPKNYKGSWHYDPRDELRHRARVAAETNDKWLAIPIELAIAVADLRECSATTIVKGDENGPYKQPITVRCRKAADHHTPLHSTGSLTWE